MAPTVQIVLKRELHHEQIEFPKDIPCPANRRGGRGSSLHLQRGKVRDVTQDELDWIKSNRPEVFRCLDVLPAPRQPSRAMRRIQQAQERASAAARVPEPVEPAKPAPRKPRARKSKTGAK